MIVIKNLEYIRTYFKKVFLVLFVIVTVLLLGGAIYLLGFISSSNSSMAKLPHTGTFRYVDTEEKIEAEISKESVFELYSNNSSFEGAYPNFADIVDAKLVLTPEDSNLGEYSFVIKSSDENASYTYRFKVTVKMREVDFGKLEEDVRAIIGDEELSKYAVYVYDLKREDGFDINGDVVMRPGSTSKLPYGIIILRDVDAGKYSLDFIKPSLEKMLQWSDNNAMMYIDSLIGGFEVHDQRVKDELGINNYFRLPHTCTAKDIGKTYYGIYHQKFLSKELNDYLINTLINVAPGFDNRLKQGIPKSVNVAHKTGYVWTDYGIAYNDTALVFGQETDFIIVVLDKDTTPEAAMAKMKPIAATVYNALDGGKNPQVLGISTVYDYQQVYDELL